MGAGFSMSQRLSVGRKNPALGRADSAGGGGGSVGSEQSSPTVSFDSTASLTNSSAVSFLERGESNEEDDKSTSLPIRGNSTGKSEQPQSSAFVNRQSLAQKMKKPLAKQTNEDDDDVSNFISNLKSNRT